MRFTLKINKKNSNEIKSSFETARKLNQFISQVKVIQSDKGHN